MESRQFAPPPEAQPQQERGLEGWQQPAQLAERLGSLPTLQLQQIGRLQVAFRRPAPRPGAPGSRPGPARGFRGAPDRGALEAVRKMKRELLGSRMGTTAGW